mmetsp:Transcript_72811/g.209017  ORF Transcript_72811/g.209017 Transcript_72811/m.209017 type:complete len:208 (+) Transcript_72811:111-734(+)
MNSASWVTSNTRQLVSARAVAIQRGKRPMQATSPTVAPALRVPTRVPLCVTSSTLPSNNTSMEVESVPQTANVSPGSCSASLSVTATSSKNLLEQPAKSFVRARPGTAVPLSHARRRARVPWFLSSWASKVATMELKADGLISTACWMAGPRMTAQATRPKGLARAEAVRVAVRPKAPISPKVCPRRSDARCVPMVPSAWTEPPRRT